MPSKDQDRFRVFAVSVLFGVAILLLLSISILAWISRSNLDEAQLTAINYRDLDRRMAELGNFLLVAETNQRGFLLTGDAEYLNPYNEALARERSTSDDVEKFESIFPDLLGRLSLLRKKLTQREQQLRSAVAVRETAGFEEALETLQQEGDTSISLQIREEISDLQEEISIRLVTAENEYRTQVRRRTWIMNAAAATALVAGMVGLAFLIGHLRARGREEALEREKLAAERSDREKSKFLASMNHEIRTPLNAMLGFSELLRTEVESSRGIRYLKAIEESGNSLAELINDILDLSKIEAGHLELEKEPVRIREFASGLRLLFENQVGEKGLDFFVEVNSLCPEIVLVDSMRLRQVLVNLIGNAIKFTPTGHVKVDFSAKNSGSDGEMDLVVSVADTGRGIAKEKQETIFKPFQQARLSDEMKGGTGLGLSISKELVSLMGGRIELESELEKGSRFFVILEDIEEVSDLGETVPELEEDWNFDLIPKSNVLVVDDNDYNRELIAGFFNESHHNLGFAINGQDALEELERNDYDLVLMDIRMPIMDGEEARQRILENPKLRSLPVVAVTASSLLREEKRLRKVFSGYVRKPFTGEKLYEAVKSVLSPETTAGRGSESQATPTEAPREDRAFEPIDDGPLLQRLQEIYDAKWEQLSQAMVFSEIADVASTLSEMGKEHDSKPVCDYAAILKDCVERFDQSALEKELSRFTELIKPR